MSMVTPRARSRSLRRPGTEYFLVWDWRLDPRAQLGLLRNLINVALHDPISVSQNLSEVVLVGHSFGGLFIRAALEEPDIASKVRRVLTLGTPYWGAPKAIFPLASALNTAREQFRHDPQQRRPQTVGTKSHRELLAISQ